MAFRKQTGVDDIVPCPCVVGHSSGIRLIENAYHALRLYACHHQCLTLKTVGRTQLVCNQRLVVAARRRRRRRGIFRDSHTATRHGANIESNPPWEVIVYR